MSPLQRVLRPAGRHIRTTPLANAARARRQSTRNSDSGPYDPVPKDEMAVGELEGAKFKIEPLRRTGEDPETMRARLTCTSPSPLPPSLLATLLTWRRVGGGKKQTSPASAAPSNQTSSSRPSQPRTSPP